MSTRRKDPFSEAIVGLFMLAVLALLVYFTIIISGVDVLQGRRKVVANVVFTDVGGLKDHDSVMYRGTKVGAVEAITLSPSNLVVTIEIDRDVILRETCRISVCNLSMLGGNYLLLEEGEGEVLPLDTTLFKGEQPTDWMRDVSNIAKNINEFTSGGELKAIVTNIEAASEKVLEVVSRIERGEGTVGKLLSSDDTVYNDLRDAVGGANIAISNVNKIVERVERGEGTVGKLLSSDDTIYKDLQNTISNASQIVERLNRGEGFAGRLLAEDDPIGAEVDASLAAFKAACESFDARGVTTSAETLLTNLNVVAERLRDGDGSLGKLINEPELYNEIEGLARDVRQTLDNFRDTTPISTFGSLIMGGL
ncbi:MAG: MCE family protein [Kiritimatiellae bacterium]|nr:MCE family protein [Kiritimatiellia bacterium]